jgi:NTE family protein
VKVRRADHYLNQQSTSFVLSVEAVDRLRAAAGTIIMASPEFQRLLKDVGARVISDKSVASEQTGAPSAEAAFH